MLFFIYFSIVFIIMSFLRIASRRLLLNPSSLVHRAVLVTSQRRVLFSTQIHQLHRSFSNSTQTGTQVKKFEADTQKLLDIVAKSLYSDKEARIYSVCS